MSQRLEQLSLPFTRVSAVYGASLTDDELNLHYSSALNEACLSSPALCCGNRLLPEPSKYLADHSGWQSEYGVNFRG